MTGTFLNAGAAGLNVIMAVHNGLTGANPWLIGFSAGCALFSTIVAISCAIRGL